MTEQEKFKGLYDEVMYWLGEVTLSYIKENPKMALRRCWGLLCDAIEKDAMPVNSNRANSLYKEIVKQLKFIEDVETVDDPKRLYNHILRIREKAEELH